MFICSSRFQTLSNLCSQGTRIQGDSLRDFAPYLEKNVSVGSVYAITGFALQPPRSSYRACHFRHWLTLGPATKYELLPPDVGAACKPESYKFVPFAQFPGRLPPCPYLTGSRLSFGVPFALRAFQILCKTTASSVLASRVFPDPLHPSAESLRTQYITTSSFFSHPFSLSVRL
ncbi:hypothetical protein LINGRAHAP2_LOCUS13841, partial [Linum grandiflorum]